MSEQQQEAQPTEPVAPNAETAETQPAEIDWKAKAREWEKRAKDNFAQINELKPLADQFRALEEASKSEAQRLADAAETAKREAEAARSDAIRYKVAATHGIDAEHFDLLGSGTEEEISARAEKIAALIAAKAQAQATPTPLPTRPVEQMRPGATPGEAESAEDVLYKQLFG
ncbi:MAG TPA: hypothetical protein VFH56_10975 [Acidimicrobiales bacterium]|nr:hypothetical protein [Acidimicrobiales bacterium]